MDDTTTYNCLCGYTTDGPFDTVKPAIDAHRAVCRLWVETRAA